MAVENRFAVLIDADNISDKYIRFIMDEISNEGIATYKRIYGDWTKPDLGAWKKVLLEYSITPVQQYGYTAGKNSTDAAMIIDAMDILYSDNVEGFCLVSSDSDFTRLASRLREAGKEVVGMGERKTPKPFVVACNKFKYLDILAKQETEEKEKVKDDNFREKMIKAKTAEIKKLFVPLPEGFDGGEEGDGGENGNGNGNGNGEPEMTPLETISEAVLTIIRENSDEDGWVFIADIGSLLLKRYPDFDVRNFGFKKLTPFINSFKTLEIRAEKHGSSKLVYAREREMGEIRPEGKSPIPKGGKKKG
ncbi:MAG: NYN domain-containing protein [Anaerovoracaceae bacterium]|jgi:uncharacterized LabA/DUF88 family protein